MMAPYPQKPPKLQVAPVPTRFTWKAPQTPPPIPLLSPLNHVKSCEMTQHLHHSFHMVLHRHHQKLPINTRSGPVPDLMTGPPPSLPTPRRLESWASASNAASAAATARKGTTSSRRSARTWRGPRSAEDTSSATKRPDQSAVWRMKTKGSLATGVCVCVCPWTKGFLPPFHTPFTHRFNRRGQRDLQLWPLPTKLHTGRSGKRTCAVTLLHSSVLCFDAMVLHATTPKQVSFRRSAAA